VYTQKTYEFVLRAQQPIAHSAGTEGNHSYLMTRGQVQLDGSIVDIPIVSGDTMRHGLREAVAYAFLDAAGLLDKPAFSKAALRLLFNGGMVTGRGDASVIKLDLYREMVNLIPPLGLLGGCANNRVIQGYIWVDDALLICDETRHLLPSKILDWCEGQNFDISESTAYMEVAQRVRMDSTLEPNKVRLLSIPARVELNQTMVLSEEAHTNDDIIGIDETKCSMMPRTSERIKAGSLFYWSITGNIHSDLEMDTFNTMIATFLTNARVGGQKGRGCGLLKAIPGGAWDVSCSPFSERTSNMDLAPELGKMFKAHVQERAAQVKKFLCEVDA